MSSSHNRIHVLHGVNLDQLGGRDPDHYGSETLTQLEHRVRTWARELGFEPSFFQTNFEGEMVEIIHRMPGVADGALINAGAWTHYSWALHDALEFAGVPTVEVHLSDVASRESWRQTSVFDGLVVDVVSGRGAEGYKAALEILARELDV